MSKINKVKCQMSKINKVNFDGAYLRSSSGHFWDTPAWNEIGQRLLFELGELVQWSGRRGGIGLPAEVHLLWNISGGAHWWTYLVLHSSSSREGKLHHFWCRLAFAQGWHVAVFFTNPSTTTRSYVIIFQSHTGGGGGYITGPESHSNLSGKVSVTKLHSGRN